MLRARSRARRNTVLFVAAVGAVALAIPSCGTDDDGSGGSGSGGAPSSSSTMTTSGTMSSVTTTSSNSTSTGTPACVPADCSDNVACTDDTCKADGTCVHVVNAAACVAGQFCDLMKGCTGAPICATVNDCKTAWMGDPCKTHLECDPVTSLCSYELLDKDNDNHAPIVCGGDDCDDNNPLKKPGAMEKCDGKDDDCSGVPDEGAVCSNPLLSCQNGTCLCAPANTCPDGCIDMKTDSQHCGNCTTKCDPGHQCVNGMCGGCFPGESPCGANCYDLNFDEQHCGNCTTVCPTPTTCSSGSCMPCPAPTPDACGGVCVSKATDEQNCGTCGHACAAGQFCVSSTCQNSGVSGAGPSATTGSGGFCGDGNLNASLEQCDDGNMTDGDGCSSNCMNE